ncbi:rhsC in rhs element domain protein [Escherichia coli]|nr:rhsC in rhs element domain protein [Escherichia coli]
MTQYGGPIVQGSAGVRIGAQLAWRARCVRAG